MRSSTSPDSTTHSDGKTTLCLSARASHSDCNRSQLQWLSNCGNCKLALNTPSALLGDVVLRLKFNTLLPPAAPHNPFWHHICPRRPHALSTCSAVVST